MMDGYDSWLNLATVMYKDVKTAMQFQHPELDIVRAALN